MGIHRIGTFAVLLAATVCLAGCSATQSGPSATTALTAASTPSTAVASATPTPAEPTPAEPTKAARMEKWIDLKAGDCLAAPPSDDPAEVTVTVVDCATPHLAEAYLRADIPVDAAVTNTANQQCAAGFTQYTGLTQNGSPYTISYLIDSEQDRTSNNPLPSTVICLLQGNQGQSFGASARR
jgi:hypothetical protein